MKIIVFDTETTGLPQGRNTSILETDKWPYIVQISWLVYDTETQKCDMVDHIIDCEVDIPEESTQIHGISKRRASLKGIPISIALDEFDIALQSADIVVAHNISFDKRVCMVEAIRKKRKQYFTRDGVRKEEYCTMKNTKDLCAIEKVSQKGDTYYKYPTLSELHDKMFGFHPKGTHDSMADVLICFRCYMVHVHRTDIVKQNASVRRIYELYCGSY